MISRTKNLIIKNLTPQKHFMTHQLFLGLLCITAIPFSRPMGMQTDTSERFSLLSKQESHNANADRFITQKITPANMAQPHSDNRNQQRNAEAELFIAAQRVKPETMAKILSAKNLTFDLETLNAAYTIVNKAHYCHSWHPLLTCVENFFPKAKFEADKKACLVLLVAAQSPDKKKD